MEILEELKLPFTWEEFSGKVLPIVGGGLTIHFLGEKVEDFVARWVPSEWVSVAAKALIGAGILVGNALVVPAEYKEPVRLAAYTSFGLAIMNALKTMGIIGSSKKASKAETKGEARKKVKKGSYL